jgi:hypothetical protein
MRFPRLPFPLRAAAFGGKRIALPPPPKAGPLMILACVIAVGAALWVILW